LFFAVSVEFCKKNKQFIGSMACSKVEAHLADARIYMLTHPKEFDAVTTFSSFARLSIINDYSLLCK